MWVDKKVVLKIASSIIKAYFPNNDGVSISRDKESWDDFYVGVHISESDYIADLLSSDLDLSDIARQVEKELEKMGYERKKIVIERKMSSREWDNRVLKQLALGC